MLRQPGQTWEKNKDKHRDYGSYRKVWVLSQTSHSGQRKIKRLKLYRPSL